MSLMYSILEKLDGTECYVSNAILSKEYIHNIRRSPPQSEAIEIPIPLSTKLDKIDQLEVKLNQFLADRPRDYRGPTSVQIKQFTKEYTRNLMTLIIGIGYKRNFTDMGLKGKLRNDFMRELKMGMEVLGIEIAE